MRALTESWLHVRRGVQGPLEVGPGRLQQVRGRGLAVPAPAQVGELPEQGLPVVSVQLDVGEVRQVPVPGGLHGEQGAEAGAGSARRPRASRHAVREDSRSVLVRWHSRDRACSTWGWPGAWSNSQQPSSMGAEQSLHW